MMTPNLETLIPDAESHSVTSLPEQRYVLGFNALHVEAVFMAAKTKQLPVGIRNSDIDELVYKDFLIEHDEKGKLIYLIRPAGRKLMASFTKEVVNISMGHLTRR
jgi:hypothetical protein